MGFSVRDIRAPILALAAIAVAVLLLPQPPSADAGGRACERWGHDNPAKLSKDQARQAVQCLVNKKRNHHGKRDLDTSRRLKAAAQDHSQYMRNHHCFSHECGGERSLLGRLKHVNYITGGLSRWAYAENIAWGSKGSGTPSSVVRAWMHSPPHRANMLSGTYRDLGVGFVDGTPSSRSAPGGIYTLDFGLRVR